MSADAGASADISGSHHSQRGRYQFQRHLRPVIVVQPVLTRTACPVHPPHHDH